MALQCHGRVKKQPTVALSSCEAEYMALTLCTQETMFLSMLAKDFDLKNDRPITIFGDNQGSSIISLEMPIDKIIDVVYTPTEMADLLTKINVKS